jgi:hypothetical protein
MLKLFSDNPKTLFDLKSQLTSSQAEIDVRTTIVCCLKSVTVTLTLIGFKFMMDNINSTLVLFRYIEMCIDQNWKICKKCYLEFKIILNNRKIPILNTNRLKMYKITQQ